MEEHKKLVEHISNCSNKLNFGQNIFTFDLIKDLFVYFITENGRLFSRDINKEVVFKTTKLFNNSLQSWSQSKPSRFNMSQTFLSQQAKLSLNFLTILSLEVKSFKPYIQTNNKLSEVFTKHLRTFLGSIMTYMKVAWRHLYQILRFSFWWNLFILFIPGSLINIWTISSKGLQWR